MSKIYFNGARVHISEFSLSAQIKGPGIFDQVEFPISFDFLDQLSKELQRARKALARFGWEIIVEAMDGSNEISFADAEVALVERCKDHHQQFIGYDGKCEGLTEVLEWAEALEMCETFITEREDVIQLPKFNIRRLK